MKKLLAVIFSSALLFSAAFADDIFAYVPLTGNVKKCTQIDYAISAKFGNYFRTPNLKTIHTYDAAGNETEVTETTTKDVLISKVVNVYDADNKLVEQTAFDSDEEKIWNDVITYKDGLKSDVSEYGKDGTLKSKTIYIYDNGVLVDETGYNGDGKLMWKNVYTYEGSILAKISHYDSDGDLEEAETYTYTENYAIDSITTYEAFSGKTSTLVFRYTGSIITELLTYDVNNKLTNRVLVKYDTVGNVAKLSEYNVADKFGTTVNELINMVDYAYEY